MYTGRGTRCGIDVDRSVKKIIIAHDSICLGPDMSPSQQGGFSSNRRHRRGPSRSLAPEKNDVICVMSMMTTSDDIISMAREMHGDGDSGTLNAC